MHAAGVGQMQMRPLLFYFLQILLYLLLIFLVRAFLVVIMLALVGMRYLIEFVVMTHESLSSNAYYFFNYSICFFLAFQKDDLKVVVSFLRSNKQISCIGLWGRSMGAVTRYIRIISEYSSVNW